MPLKDNISSNPTPRAADHTGRAGFIAALHDFADWLTVNPDVPAPRSQWLLLPLHTNRDVETFATQCGLEAAYDHEGNASVELTFGPLAYHAYGYADFAAHCERADETTAHRYADRHGLTFTPADTAGGAS